MKNNTHDFISILFNHCKITFLHSIRVGNDLYDFARYSGIENPQRLFLLGTFHDIGKINIHPSILNKKESLTEQEYAEIKRHTVYGEQITKNIPRFPSEFSDAILFHHENYDGSGYFGKKGEEIPLLSRMIRIVDSYDVMLHGRNYQKPVSHNQIIQEFKSLIGKHYDKDLVQAYIEFLELKTFRLFPHDPASI
jgi:HD-GYP domain-containing protein (c-di-GMP phosphodiesterase class II)